MDDAITCRVEGCESVKVVARGWCGKHYDRWRRHGSPTGGTARRYSTPEETFANRTRREGDCLVWTANLGGNGYGRMQIAGKSKYAHRYAWERVNGPIPPHLVIDHICHNPACVNIEHLRLASKSQNAAYRTESTTRSGAGRRNVTYIPGDRCFVVQVKHRGKTYGHRHASLESAVKEAEFLRSELFGQFAGRG